MTDVVELLREMISTPSVSCAVYGQPDATHGEARMVEFIKAFLAAHHIDYQVQEVWPGRENVLARVEGGDGPSLLLESHTDTVEIENMDIEPFTPDIHDGCVYGRGACDDKASLAAMMVGLVNAAEKGVAGDVTFACTADEECGFGGAKRLVESGFRADGCVVGEPTELRLIIAHKGACRLKVLTHGTSAHSSEPHKGDNAIYHMAELIGALREYALELTQRPPHPLVGSPTCSVGMIHGGQMPNIVPDLCEIILDRRMIPGEEMEGVVAEVEGVIGQAAGDRFRWSTEITLGGHPLETPPDSWVVARVAQALEVVGGDAGPGGVEYGTDASCFSRAGIPGVVIGPGSIQQAHTAVEWVDIEQVRKAALIYERICTGE